MYLVGAHSQVLLAGAAIPGSAGLGGLVTVMTVVTIVRGLVTVIDVMTVVRGLVTVVTVARGLVTVAWRRTDRGQGTVPRGLGIIAIVRGLWTVWTGDITGRMRGPTVAAEVEVMVTAGEVVMVVAVEVEAVCVVVVRAMEARCESLAAQWAVVTAVPLASWDLDEEVSCRQAEAILQ